MQFLICGCVKMVKILKHISRIKDDFDCVICGTNGVISDGKNIFPEAADALHRLYLDGKKIVLATNYGIRVRELFDFLHKVHFPVHIFHGLITAGEIAHYQLKNRNDLGQFYFPLVQNDNGLMAGLDYKKADSIVFADFVLAETTANSFDYNASMQILEQALNLKLPMVCVGNNTMMMSPDGVQNSVGSLAEQYALMGGKIITFGKPDIRIARYLTEQLKSISPERCLVIGDNMATDMKMGINFKAQTLLICSGVHQLKKDDTKKLDDLTQNFGFETDYAMETLQW